MYRMRMLFVALAIGALVSGCMTTHFANAQKTTDGKLEVSCGASSNMSSGKYVTATCTLENHTDSWMRLQVMELTPLSAKSRLLTANEINAYNEALALEQTQRAHNTAMFLAGLAIVGTIAQATSDSPAVQAAGATAVAASDLATVVTVTAEGLDQAEHGDWVYGPQHIAGGVIEIPAGMFVRRKIVLERPASHQAPIVDICFDNHGCIRAVIQ